LTLRKLGGSFFDTLDKGTYFWTAGTRAKSKGAGSVSKTSSSKSSPSSSSSSKSSSSNKSQLSKTSLSQAVKSAVASRQSTPKASTSSSTPRPIQPIQTYDFQDTTSSSSSDTPTTPITERLFNIIPSIPEVSAQTPTISSEVQSVIAELESNDSIYPEWFNNNIQWVKDGVITNEEFLNAYNNLTQREIITTSIIEEVITAPKSGTISFDNITENSVSVSWSSTSSPITGFHLVIKNQDTGQTIHVLNPLPNMTNTIFSNLDSGTNYKAYLIVINDIGNSPEVSKGFKTLGVKVIESIIMISPEVQSILTRLDNNDYTYPEWFSNNIKWVKDGTITSNEFLVAFNNLLQRGIIIDKSIPIEDTTIDLNMVSQSIGAFKLENNRVKGSIIYIAESSFNPYYYNKPITSVVSIKDQTGRTVKLKTNNLNFTATERDETINIDEEVGELDAIKIEFLVWKSVDDPIAFSKKKVDEVVAEEVGLAPCPLGQHRNFNGKCVPDDPIIGSSLLGKVMGVTAILGTLALLGSKGR